MKPPCPRIPCRPAASGGYPLRSPASASAASSASRVIRARASTSSAGRPNIDQVVASKIPSNVAIALAMASSISVYPRRLALPVLRESREPGIIEE